MKTAFTSKRIGVTVAALVLSAALVGGTAGAANAYTYDPTLSVSTKALQPGDLLQVRVNDAPPTFAVTFNGVTKTTAASTFSAPAKVGTYKLVLTVSGSVVDEVAITEGTILRTITIHHGNITRNKLFGVTGVVSPARAGVTVNLYGRTGSGAYKMLNHGTTSSTGAYGIVGKFTTRGRAYLRVVTVATPAFSSTNTASKAFTVR
jgi:hypothetical protein